MRSLCFVLALGLSSPSLGAELGFVDYISPEFVNNDTSSQGQNAHEFLRSVENDFKNLDQIRLTIDSQNIQRQGQQSIVRLSWNLRARFRQTGEEWILTDQDSALAYRLSEGEGRWMLSSISGDPIFGLSNQLGVLPVYRGSVDGIRITKDNAFGVRDGDFGAGNEALGSFTGLSLAAGGRAELVIASAQLSCQAAGDGTDNLFVSIVVRNNGRGAAQGSLRIEQEVKGLGTLVQAASLDLASGAQTAFTNGSQPVQTGISPGSLCCAKVRINADKSIQELDFSNDTLADLKFTCP